MDEEFYSDLLNFFEDFIDNVPPKLYECMHKPGEVFIHAPEFFIELFEQALLRRYLFPQKAESGIYNHFRGIPILPTYEHALIIFHKSYPIYQQDWMIRKMSLETPVVIKEERFRKTIFKLRQFIYPGETNFASN